MVKITGPLVAALLSMGVAARADTPAAPSTPVEGVVVTGVSKRCDQADAKQRVDCVFAMMKAHRKCDEKDTACIDTVRLIAQTLYPRQFERWCYNQAMRPMQMAMSADFFNNSGGPTPSDPSQEPKSAKQVCATKPK